MDIDPISQAAWTKAGSDWNALIETNKRFIKGELEMSPYHAGPLEVDSVPLINNLLHLHDHGLFTFNGQGAMKNEVEYSSGWRAWNEVSQKAYLCFITKDNSFSRELISRLMSDPEIYCAWHADHNQTHGANSSKRVCYAKGRRDKKKANLKSLEWDCSTVEIKAEPVAYPLPQLNGQKFVSVLVMFKKFGQPGLEDRVLEYIHDIEGSEEESE